MKNIFLAIPFFLLTISQKCGSQSFDKKMSTFSGSIIRQLNDLGKKEIAILNFCNFEGKVTGFTQHLTNVFRSKIKHDIKIMDTSKIEDPFYPDHLLEGKSKSINPYFLRDLNLAYVDILIFAEIYDYGDHYSLELQIIDTVSFTIVGGEILEIPKTEKFEQMNEKIIYRYRRI